MAFAGSWSVERGAHIQAFTFSSQDHGRMFQVHISKHSLFRLKITVGCRLCTCPSIHFSLDEDTLKITVGCLVCGVVCGVVCCGGVLWWCVGCVCTCDVVCGVGYLSLSCSLSFLFSFPFAVPFFFSLLSLFFSLLFLFLFLLLLLLPLLLLLLFLLFLLSSFFPSTHSSLLFPSRQQTLYKALINKHGVQL